MSCLECGSSAGIHNNRSRTTWPALSASPQCPVCGRRAPPPAPPPPRAPRGETCSGRRDWRPARQRPAGSTHLKRSQSQTLQDRMSWETLGPEPGPTWSTWQRRRARSAGRSHTIMRGRCSMRDIGERKRSMRMSASSRAPYRATVTSEQLRTTLSAITFPSQRAERSAVREASKPQ